MVRLKNLSTPETQSDIKETNFGIIRGFPSGNPLVCINLLGMRMHVKLAYTEHMKEGG